MPTKRSSQALQAAAVVLLAFLLIGLFFRGSDFGAIRASLLAASPGLVATAILVTLVGYLLRAARWRVLLSPLGSPGLGNCFSTTVIGFMVNFLVPPGRLGEVARPYLLARREGFSASGAFATILLERILDLVTVVLFIGLWLSIGHLPTRSAEAIEGLKLGGLVGLVGATVMLLVMYLVARYPEPSVARLGKLLAVLPERLRAAGARFLSTFATGLGVLADGSGVLKAAGLSLLLWLNIGLAFWLGARALSVDFEFGHTFLVIGFLTIGVAVPTPGGIGGYHVMCALALTMMFGTEESAAKAVALVNHAIAFLPVTFLGIVLFAKAGLSFRQVKTFTTSRDGEEPDDRADAGDPDAGDKGGSK